MYTIYHYLLFFFSSRTSRILPTITNLSEIKIYLIIQSLDFHWSFFNTPIDLVLVESCFSFIHFSGILYLHRPYKFLGVPTPFSPLLNFLYPFPFYSIQKPCDINYRSVKRTLRYSLCLYITRLNTKLSQSY